MVYATVAHAGDWTITPSLSVSEAFTDNSGLVSDNEDRNSDFTTQVTPGLSIAGTGARSSLTLNYANNQTFYHRKTQSDENSNSLAAVGQVELWRRFFFIDGQAAISQVIEDSTDAVSTSPTGENINRTEARSFNVSPFIRQHFGQWMDVEPRFTFNRTTTESDVVEDTRTLASSVTVTSGRQFALFPWSIVALESKTQNEGGEPSEKERRVDGSFSYILDRKLTLTGTVGWEDVRDPGLTSQPKGVTWSGGFTARPSSRGILQFSYGDRNDEREISASASYKVSSRTTVDASFTESIETSQSLIAQQVTSLTTDASTPGAVVTPFTLNGTPLFAFPDSRLGLTESTFRQQVFRLGFSGTRGRNTFFGSATWEKRDTESTGITEKSMGGSFSLTRQLSNRLIGTVGIGAQFTDFGTADERTDIDYSGATSLSYQVRKDIQATVSYNLTLKKVNNAPEDLLENSVAVGLTKSF